jgi:hypothetical protein
MCWVCCGVGVKSLGGVKEFMSGGDMFWEGGGTEEDEENG